MTDIIIILDFASEERGLGYQVNCIFKENIRVRGIKSAFDIFALSILALRCLDLNKVNMLGFCFPYYLWLSLWQMLPLPVCAARRRSAKFVMSTLFSSL